MLEFLKSYGELIASGILFIMAIITLVVKNRPKSIDDFVQVLSDTIEQLPMMINFVERKGFGEEKKEEVLIASIKHVSKLLHRNLTNNEIIAVRKKVGDQLEAILSTPQKKEEK